ncbi:hypothetical protein V6N13_029577 [Hibiscus sabdariffa]
MVYDDDRRLFDAREASFLQGTYDGGALSPIPPRFAQHLRVANLQALFNSTCLIFGASLLTATAAMLGDILGSDKPSADLMVKLYSPLLALGSLAILRGLVPQSSTTAPNVVNGPTSTLKKRT